MSKIISSDEKVTAWAVPKIGEVKKQAEKKSSPLSAEEKHQVEAAINSIKEQAYKEGFNKGQQDGLNAAQQQVNQTLQSLASIINAMATPIEQLDEAVEHELVNLCVSIAKQIVRRELKTDPGQVIAVVREALTNIPSAAQHVRVFLNPEDAILVRKIIPENAGERSWDIIEDPILTRGSCKVETETTQVDATFESRIAAIAAEILGSERQGS